MAEQTLTANKDIDYIHKDFNSSSDAIINFANVNFGPGTSANRLWTNFNVDSFSRNWLEIVAFMADVFFFYFDNQATQSYLQTATVESAVEDIAKQFGFVPSTEVSASGNVTFTFSGAATLTRGFRVASSTGLPYYLSTNLVASAAGNYIGTVIQGTIKTEQFTAVGLQNEEFILIGPNVIRDLTNFNPDDISPQITVNGNSYTLVDSFIKNNGTDLPAVKDSLGAVIGGGGRVFTLNKNASGRPYIKFGDGIFGRKLLPGEIITVTYRTGVGSAGNIAENSLTTLVDSNPTLLSVSNPNKFTGGADAQTIDQLRDLIPASLRTLNRAVSQTDYSDLLKATFTEVAAASTEQNNTDPGIDLNIYVVPTGTVITNITDNANLKTRLTNFIDRRKMVTIQFQILDGYGIDILISGRVYITNTTSKTTVKNAITTALTNYFNLNTGGPEGLGLDFAETVLTENLTKLFTSISGVSRFEFTKFTYRPRVEKNIVGINTTYNVSAVDTFPTVAEAEWLAGAAGPVTRTGNVVLYNNDTAVSFTYDSITGLVSYTAGGEVNLTNVAPGDQFRGRTSPVVDYTILGVDAKSNTLYIVPGATLDGTPGPGAGGSIRSAETVYQSFKVFKKIFGSATNLSIDSITDNSLDLSVVTGNATAIGLRVLLDNTKVFLKNEYANGQYYLVDSAGNIFEITANDSNTITASVTAINDAAVTSVASGQYKIVTKLVGSTIVFNSNIFNIQYNSNNTIYSVGGQFSNIGTIGDTFEISKLQTNRGNIGVAVDLISHDTVTQKIYLNGSPDLSGVTCNYNLVDSDGKIFNISAIDSRPLPTTFYDSTNQDSSLILKGVGLGQQYAQSFQVPSNNIYSVVSLNLKSSGNITGNLIAKIVNDDGSGLPNLSSPVATSLPVQISTLEKVIKFNSLTSVPNSNFGRIVFFFASAPTLNAGVTYHLVLTSDATYSANQLDNFATFTNTAATFSYNPLNGLIEYDSPVDLSQVQPGQYFKDGLGELYIIQYVDNSADEITIGAGLPVDTTLVNNSGSVYKKDNVYVACDISSPTYLLGNASQYNGAVWADDDQGPLLNRFPQPIDLMFTVEGPKSIVVDSNLVPTLGAGASLTERYYDDANTLSFIIGLSNGLPTFAQDVSPIGRGTVATVANSRVDTFILRTSQVVNDITNLRSNEIPQLNVNDITLDVIGGVD
jgi:hypothetical protein